MQALAIRHGRHAADRIARMASAAHIAGSLQCWMFPPRVIGVQHVPLWNIAGPHTGNLRPGPFGDPVFSLLTR
jgi:hypothetical protein